jgi:hypothetical protein
MSDLSFVAGEFPRLASTAREAAEAVRSARPEGGASAFASAMPGTSLSSQMHGVEDKFADQATKTGTSLDEHADSLEAAERDFIATEDENSQLIGSITCGEGPGDSRTGGRGDEHEGPRLVPLPSPIGGNPTPPFGRHRGNGGKQRGHQGDGRPRRRRPNIGIGRPRVEPTPYDPVGPIKPLDPIITGPTGPHPLPKPAIELPEMPPVKLPRMGNPTPIVDPIEPLDLGANRFSAELGG